MSKKECVKEEQYKTMSNTMLYKGTILRYFKVTTLLVSLLFILTSFLWADNSKEEVVKGKVSSEDGGIPNVVVTDGFQCVVTNKNGHFSLKPHKDASFIYISTPAGFLPEEEMNVPQFFKRIEKNKKQKYDFLLKKNLNNDEKHILLVHADPQFFKEDNFEHYKDVVKDIQLLKENYPGRDILGIDCGDLVGDKPELYPLYIEHLNRTGIPFYRLPGNHDLQFGGRTTETSTERYEKTFGPDHYSFNRGLVHYIVLNNVFYVGRDYFYMGYIDEKTFRWLEQDLAHVPMGSTIFVSMHIPGRLDEEVAPFQYNSRTISTQTINISSLFEMLKPYNTHLLTGHMHYNRNIIHSENLYEHNTGAVSGAWWQGEYGLDGTPVGYGVYEIDGSDVEWYFKSVGHNKDYQMRVFPPQTTEEYGLDVVVNIWNWDRNWKVEWYEDGESMGDMRRFEGIDPEVKRAYSDKEKLDFKWIEPANTDHLFRASPKKKNSTIKVVAIDPFGKEYTEIIQQ